MATKAGQIAVVKCFSATKYAERNNLGDEITAWLRANQGLEVVDKIVTQSSDSEFHCLSVTLFLAWKGSR